MINKKTLIIGSIITIMLVVIVLAEVISNIPSEIEIDEIRYSEWCVEVFIKGYSERYVPCIEYKDFNNSKQFEDKLKSVVVEIDNVILNSSPLQPIENIDKFNLVSQLDGKIIQK